MPLLGGIVAFAAIVIAMILCDRSHPAWSDVTTAAVEAANDNAGETIVDETPDEAGSAEAPTRESKPSNAEAGWLGCPKDAPSPAIAPFDANKAKQL